MLYIKNIGAMIKIDISKGVSIFHTNPESDLVIITDTMCYTFKDTYMAFEAAIALGDRINAASDNEDIVIHMDKLVKESKYNSFLPGYMSFTHDGLEVKRI